MTDLLDEFGWRGLVHQATDTMRLYAHLQSPRRAYVGFDPVSDSLTIGNLIPLLMLRHLQRCGHSPYVVVGGGTGLIGDPSGKALERGLLSEDEVHRNVAAQRPVIERLMDFDGPNRATILNNEEWLSGLGFLQTLRNVGKHLSVNVMLRKEAVKRRIEGQEQGLSYTEFSYQVLQAYDYLHLHERHGVTLQMGGSDQWGNIIAGMDLIKHRTPDAPVFGLTCPMLTQEDGGKFGRTEVGTIWLTEDRTTPYQLFQWAVNLPDDDACRLHRIVTDLTRSEVEDLEADAARSPADRIVQHELAATLTGLIHGREGAAAAAEASDSIFRTPSDLLSANEVSRLLETAPSIRLPLGDLTATDVIDLLVASGLADSRNQARRLIDGGGVAMNGTIVGDGTAGLTAANLVAGNATLLRRGKRHWVVVHWE